MADDKKLDKRRQILRARGVPEKFVEALATRNESVAANIAYFAVAIAFLAVISFGGAVWQQPVLALFARVLYSHVRPALLIGALPLGFVAILLSLIMLVMFTLMAIATLVSAPVKPWPAYSATASTLRVFGRHETLRSIRRREAYARLSYLNDDTAFLDAVIRRGKGHTLRLPLFAGMALALACLLASQCYWRLTDEAFEVRRPWSDHVYPLTSVTGAEVTCGPSGRSSDVLKYWLVFPQGRFDIVESQSTSQPEVSWPEAIGRVGRIHQYLLDHKVPVRVIGRPGGTAAQFNACLTRWRARSGITARFPAPLPET